MKENEKYPHLSKPWMKYYNQEKVNQEDPKTNITDYIKQKNTHNLGGIAETYYGKKITYRELFEKVDTYSKMLTGLGVSKGSRIMYLVPNIPEKR